jgi:hypothetical protein
MLSLSLFATCHPKKKKKVSVGRVSSAATKIALLRTTTTPQETVARLAYQMNRAAASRASETPLETEARLVYQRNLAAASRASETPHETGGRLANTVHRVLRLVILQEKAMANHSCTAKLA